MILDIARAVPIENEIARRGIRLAGHRSERVGPCPVCGGRDRFSINTTKQLWHCRGCHRGGDVIDLVQHLDGVNHKTAARTLAGTERKNVPLVMAKPQPRQPQIHESDKKNTERAIRIWGDSSPIAGTLAETYLRRRGLDLPDDDSALRYVSRCPFGETAYPAMVALFRDVVTNDPNIHRIALATDGVSIEKRMLGPVGGAAVKIDADENVEYGLTIAEGIETALAARMKGYCPCWALGSAGAMRNFPVLDGIESLTIMVDNDPADQRGRRAGDEAATECWHRWNAAGREVHAYTTDRPGTDIADVVEGVHHE